MARVESVASKVRSALSAAPTRRVPTGERLRAHRAEERPVEVGHAHQRSAEREQPVVVDVQEGIATKRATMLGRSDSKSAGTGNTSPTLPRVSTGCFERHLLHGDLRTHSSQSPPRITTTS